MNNDFFDFPIQVDKQIDFINKLKAEGWKIDKSRWTGKESLDFYKGMYAGFRIAQSFIKHRQGLQLQDTFSHASLDLLFLIGEKMDNTNFAP